MRNFADQIRPTAGRAVVVLGTDGFGRSDFRVASCAASSRSTALRDRRGAEGAGR